MITMKIVILKYVAQEMAVEPKIDPWGTPYMSEADKQDPPSECVEGCYKLLCCHVSR